MSRCLAIFHKQLGHLVLLEPTLRHLSRASGSKVDLITRSGFRQLMSLMPNVDFLRRPSRRAYDALWCFDDRKKSLLPFKGEPEASLGQPGAPIQWYQRFSPWSSCPISATLIGKTLPRLELFPEEPVIEVAIRLWTTHVSL